MTAKRHTFHRPAWTCSVSGNPYPCLICQQQLLKQYEGNLAGLRLTMTQCRDAFLADNPGLSPEADARFLDWIPA